MSPSPEDCTVGFVWSSEFERFDFGRRHPIRVGRFQMAFDLVNDAGFLEHPSVRLVDPTPLSDEMLVRIHSEEFIKRVKQISLTGQGEIDIDTPGFKGIYEYGQLSCGATLTGVREVASGRLNHFLSPTGGFHHAKYDSGGGFCIFNDVAAAVFALKDMGFERVLVADFDVHHGNGTETYFYEDPGVMVISFHEDPEWMYPHDGHIGDIGAGKGRGYNINMHFPMDSCDSVYRYAFDQLVPSLVEFYQPEFILFLPGFDAHYNDPLAHLKITTNMIRYTSEYMHDAAHTWSKGRLGVLSAGGYDATAFGWGLGTVLSVLTGLKYSPPKQTPPFDDDEETWDIVRSNVLGVKEAVFPELGIS